jgi:hypothetical protein
MGTYGMAEQKKKYCTLINCETLVCKSWQKLLRNHVEMISIQRNFLCKKKIENMKQEVHFQMQSTYQGKMYWL